jgi:hypothetical protein
MTTVAMAAGMMPIALGLEGDASFRTPMAVVVIGGLITSTVLSLLVVPVVFEIVDEIKLRLVPRKFRSAAVHLSSNANTEVSTTASLISLSPPVQSAADDQKAPPKRHKRGGRRQR